MRKSTQLLLCLMVLFVASLTAKAQNVSITLNPGWNWISYTRADTLDLDTALVSLTPTVGDLLKSQSGFSTYGSNGWAGSFQRFIPGQGYMYCSMRNEPVSFSFSGTATPVVVTADPAYVSSVSAMVGGNVTMADGDMIFARGVCWGTEPMPTVHSNLTNEGARIGEFSSLLMELAPNTTYYVRAYAVTYCGLAYGEVRSFTTLESSEIHGYVDLGLPSGLWWATCNVGADTPEGYGDYFAWGETQPKDSYDWSTYQYCNGSGTTLTKYCNNPDYGYSGFTDTLTTLQLEDDAASVNWGAEWRMPTKEEWEELCQHTTNTWTTHNGVYGRLFTASNGNAIFLPAASFRSGYGMGSVGDNGEYLSSSLDVVFPDNAWYLAFDPVYYSMTNSGGRCGGQSVRPVRPAKNHFYLLSTNSIPLDSVNYVTEVLNYMFVYPNIVNPHVDLTLPNKPSTVVVEDDDINAPVGAQRKYIVAIAPVDYNVVKVYALGFDQGFYNNVTPITLPFSVGDPTLYHVFIRRQTTVSGFDANRIVYNKQ